MESQDKMTAVGIVEAYNLMDYNAVGISRYDLAAGIDFLQELAAKSRFAWVSANLVTRADKKPVFNATTRLDLPSFHIGVIGITGNDILPQISDRPDLTLLDWKEALPPLVADMTTTCDFIILLSSLPPQDNLEVARTFADINLIVQANGGADNRPPTLHRNSLITESQNQGKYLGALYARWQPSGLWQNGNPAADLASKRAELDSLDWQLGRMQKQGDPEIVLKNDPGRLATYQRLAARQQELALEVNELQQVLGETEDPGKAKAAFDHLFLALETTLPDQPEVLSVVNEIKEKIAALGRETASQASQTTSSERADDPKNLGYVGWQSCTGCHQTQATAWQKTSHFIAYQTLEAKGQQFNLDCISCHVTAVIDGSESYSLTLPLELLSVSCEACHGPGAAHTKDPATAKLAAKPELGICLRCHTPEQNDSFDYEVRRKLVH